GRDRVRRGCLPGISAGESMSQSMKAQADKALGLLRLHGGPEILVLTNVWDVASARLVEHAGFKAIATSSAAIANSLGYPDGERISRGDAGGSQTDRRESGAGYGGPRGRLR